MIKKIPSLLVAAMTLFSGVSGFSSDAIPWWDQWPRISISGDSNVILGTHSNASVRTGGLSDEGWGALFRENAMLDGREQRMKLSAAGIHQLAYVKNQGAANSIIGALHKTGENSFEMDPRSSGPRITAHFWNWSIVGPTLNPEANFTMWFGLPDFVDGLSYLGPFTRLNPKYAVAEPTYVDGTRAHGYLGSNADPRNARLWDAVGSKNLNGTVFWEYNYAESGKNSAGHIPVRQHDGTVRFAGTVWASKDTASPWWTELDRTEIRDFLRAGAHGFWWDNYSGWNLIGSQPIYNSFGDWSVATFPTFVSKNTQSGVFVPEGFDIRSYLKTKFSELTNRDGSNLEDGFWSDRYWTADTTWRAFLAHKAYVSMNRSRAIYGVVKEEAQNMGMDPKEILVAGNDIPGMSFAAFSGEEMDMVSSEHDPGSMPYASLGMGLPPEGHVGPHYAVATRYGKSRHANIWYYLDSVPELKKNSLLGEVLGYEALANNVLLMTGEDNFRAAGTHESATKVNNVTAALTPIFGARTRTGKVGLVYSIETQHSFLTPGGFYGFSNTTSNANDPAFVDHNFGYYGWGAALEQLHIPYVAVPDFRLNVEEIKALSVLILPHVRALDDKIIFDVLIPFLNGGGTILISGQNSGEMSGKENLYRKHSIPLIYNLTRNHGGAIFIQDNPGLDFYMGRENPTGFRRTEALNKIRNTMQRLIDQRVLNNAIDATSFPGKFQVVTHTDTGKFFIDLVNVDMNLSDPSRVSLAPSPGGYIRFRTPAEWGDQGVQATFFDADVLSEVSINVVDTGEEALYLQIPAFRAYGTVVLKPNGKREIRLPKIELISPSGSLVFASQGGGLSGNGSVMADGMFSSAMTHFYLDNLGAGRVRSGDTIRLRVANGNYVSVECNGGSQPESNCGELSTNRDVPAEWETFVIRTTGAAGSFIQEGDMVSIVTSTGYFLTSEGAGGPGSVVVANRSVLGPWEMFKIHFVNQADIPGSGSDSSGSNLKKVRH